MDNEYRHTKYGLVFLEYLDRDAKGRYAVVTTPTGKRLRVELKDLTKLHFTMQARRAW